MTQAVLVNGRYPKYKKDLKAAVKDGAPVHLVETSIFGRNYEGDVKDAPDGRYFIVGPHPKERKWYANIVKRGDKIAVK